MVGERKGREKEGKEGMREEVDWLEWRRKARGEEGRRLRNKREEEFAGVEEEIKRWWAKGKEGKRRGRKE